MGHLHGKSIRFAVQGAVNGIRYRFDFCRWDWDSARINWKNIRKVWHMNKKGGRRPYGGWIAAIVCGILCTVALSVNIVVADPSIAGQDLKFGMGYDSTRHIVGWRIQVVGCAGQIAPESSAGFLVVERRHGSSCLFCCITFGGTRRNAPGKVLHF